jgi:hypothetical protein
MAEKITDAYVIGSEAVPWTAARIEKSFAGKALIYCTRGTVTIAKHVEEVAYVAPVAADPEAEPPVEEVLEVEYVAPEPNADSPRLLPIGAGGLPMIVDGDIWLYNADYGTDVNALLHVVEYDLTADDLALKEPFALYGSSSISSTAAVVAPYADLPAAEAAVLVTSNDVNDTAEGTGARTIVINYLDDAFAEKSETVILDGTTGVATTATDIYRIISAYVASAGSGGTNAGDIYITDATSTYNYAIIEGGQNIDRKAVYTVPAGKTLYITSMSAAFAEAVTGFDYGTFYIMANQLNGVKSTRQHIFAKVMSRGAQETIKFDAPLKFVAGVDVAVYGVSTAEGAGEVALFGRLA